MKTRAIAMLCAAGWLLPTVGGCNGLPIDPHPVLLDMRDNGTTVQVSASDSLIILLPANPSTGYAWLVTEGDPNMLYLEQIKFVPDSASGGAVPGSGGNDLVEIFVRTAGTTTLTLEYREGGAPGTLPPANKFSITLQVAGGWQW